MAVFKQGKARNAKEMRRVWNGNDMREKGGKATKANKVIKKRSNEDYTK
jgi:hypothetical protein